MVNVFGANTEGLDTVKQLLEGLLGDLQAVNNNLTSQLADIGSPFSDDEVGHNIVASYVPAAGQVFDSAQKISQIQATTAHSLGLLAAILARTEQQNAASIGPGGGG